MYFADLHIHSKYSRATSKDCDLPHLRHWAMCKGLQLVGTGDCTHPAWRQCCAEQLTEAEPGLYRLRPECRLNLPTPPGAAEPRFVLSGEISSIYKQGGKTRKVHNLLLLPSLHKAEELAGRLEAIGNLHSDGRPILGLSSRDLFAIALECCPETIFLPAHIWTPHFSMFGAFSGFSSIEECFLDLAPLIRAAETGLSSDPAMNRRVAQLDRLFLISNSDAHSPSKLGREANALNAPLSYPGLQAALTTGVGFLGTVEFFPEEGKYHLDGHRACGVCLTPEEAEALGNRCPACGKPLTIGVEHRVCELASRTESAQPPTSRPYRSLVPLPEAVGASLGAAPGGKKAGALCQTLLSNLGSEFSVLLDAPYPDLARLGGPLLAEGVRRLREGRVLRQAGYDGVYGVISLFAPGEREAFLGQLSLLPSSAPQRAPKAPAPARQAKAQEPAAPAAPAVLSEEQQRAAHCPAPAVAVVAGPGAGKTKTLVERLLWLLTARGARPEEITAVTFTRAAAAELRARVEAALGKQTAAALTIGTFHAVCQAVLPPKPLVGRAEALALAEEAAAEVGERLRPQAALQAISRAKSNQKDSPLRAAYDRRLHNLGLRDLDDLLLDALAQPCAQDRRFTHLLADEFQDVNPLQRALTLHWAKAGGTLFVIGDPDQSIYGFRGASAACFAELQKARPGLVTLPLSANYRSTPQILSCALAAIAKNPGGARPLSAVRPSGPAVRAHLAESPQAEAAFVAEEIARMAGGLDMLSASAMERALAAPRAFSEIALLCRTRRQLEFFERALVSAGIPCAVSGRGSFLEDPACAAALAFFRFWQSPQSPALAGFALRPFLPTAQEAAQAAAAYAAGLPPKRRLGFAAVREALAPAAPLLFLSLCDALAPRAHKARPATLLKEWAALTGGSEALERLQNTALFFPRMADFLAAADAGEEADLLRAAGQTAPSGAVRLMTLHAAKGLEFPAVFLCGLTQGAFPLERADGAADPEEERRLLFVGMTRACEELVLTGARPASAYLAELPEEVERSEGKPSPSRKEKQLRLF